ncbi:thiamine biosynthetic bifunctional enzyme TH1, chloroplastic-like [Punica granatum]|uniref:thiamine phosphate synthase n=1 Tax=Punica granatum TaxID=22663 RepID=A0A6P8BV44_PUNGR|nr:thiamine biosynthetic bifunctional enzyme TH1, chloroplastic-like [Punica granatum]
MARLELKRPVHLASARFLSWPSADSNIQSTNLLKLVYVSKSDTLLIPDNHVHLEVCRSHGVPLLINDRVDVVALACDADGVHVGQSDMPVRVVRALLGPDKIIDVSCQTPEQAHRAWTDGTDYIGCGGVYPTNTKANNRTIELDGLKAVCSASKLPVVAISGIGPSNAGAVMETGAPNLKGVAVVSALFDRECIVEEARKLCATLEKGKTSNS